MGSKSMGYIGAGVLLILYPILNLLQSAWQIMGHITLDIFRYGNFKIFLCSSMNFSSWLWFGLLILAGVICLGKAFVDEMIPDIALVGIFGVLTVLAIISFFSYFIDMCKYGGFGRFYSYVSLISNIFSILVFGSMAAIIFLKASFGSLYFAPAGLKFVQMLLNFVLSLFAIKIGIAHLLVGFIIDGLLLGALFLLGKSVTNN